MVPAIKKAYSKEGTTYVAPVRFIAPCIVGDSEIMSECDSIEDLMMYQKAHPDTPVLANVGAEYLYMNQATIYTKEWENQEMDKSLESIKSVLEGFKGFQDAYSKDDEEVCVGDVTTEGVEFAFGNTKVVIWYMSDIWELLFASDAVHRKGEGSLKLMGHGDNVCFLPKCIVGVSKAQEKAKDIISFMLKEENQLVDTKEGLPTSQKALDKWLSGECINKDVTWTTGNAMDQCIDANWENQRGLVEVFASELERMDSPIEYNYDLVMLTLDDATAYFNGDKTMDQVLDSIKGKLEVFMREKAN